MVNRRFHTSQPLLNLPHWLPVAPRFRFWLWPKLHQAGPSLPTGHNSALQTSSPAALCCHGSTYSFCEPCELLPLVSTVEFLHLSFSSPWLVVSGVLVMEHMKYLDRLRVLKKRFGNHWYWVSGAVLQGKTFTVTLLHFHPCTENKVIWLVVGVKGVKAPRLNFCPRTLELDWVPFWRTEEPFGTPSSECIKYIQAWHIGLECFCYVLFSVIVYFWFLVIL